MVACTIEQRWKILRHYFENHDNVICYGDRGQHNLFSHSFRRRSLKKIRKGAY